MPRPKPECGTRQGYDYHIRHGENACGPCLEAKSQDMADWRARKSGTANMEDVDDEPEVRLEDLDEVATAKENLRRVRGALRICPPNAVATLTKREMELTQFLIKKREDAKGTKKTLADQLAERRAARSA